MTFGNSGGGNSGGGSHSSGSPKAGSSGFNSMNNGGAPFTPRSPMGSVLLSGLMGLRPNSNPALSTSFAKGSGAGLGRRPALSGRTVMGGL